MLPKKRTRVLAAEHSLQPGKVKEVSRRPQSRALGGHLSACLASVCVRLRRKVKEMQTCRVLLGKV